MLPVLFVKSVWIPAYPLHQSFPVLFESTCFRLPLASYIIDWCPGGEAHALSSQSYPSALACYGRRPNLLAYHADVLPLHPAPFDHLRQDRGREENEEEDRGGAKARSLISQKRKEQESLRTISKEIDSIRWRRTS